MSLTHLFREAFELGRAESVRLSFLATVLGSVLVEIDQCCFANDACFVSCLAPCFGLHIGPSKANLRDLD